MAGLHGPVYQRNPTGIIPMLVVRLKDHKPQLPVRPIVPKNQAPTYFIEKAYVTLLKILLPPSPFTTKSTVDFIEKLKAITLPPDFLLATMDVVQLYPSINVDSVSKEIKTSIMSTIFSQETKDILIRGLNLILSSNFFTFDGTIYLQKHGAPMGSPISGLIAEFVLIPIDQQVNTLPNLKPYFWIRYVDDVFLIWEHGANEFNNFSQFVNTLNPDIQFTALLEDHGRISFLDVMLERKGTSILRSIYRKPGNALCTITASSLAPRNYKSAAYIAYIIRAIRVCSPENLAQEFVEIKSIAQKNGFPIVTIDKLINKLCNRTIAKTISINPDKRLMMQYIPNLFEKIRNRLKYYGINLVAKTLPKLGAFLPSKFDSFPPLDRNGIYEIPFLDRHGSKSFYVGMTKRKLKHRKYEHIHDIKTGSLNTALSRKYADELIDILFDQTKIIAPFNTNFQTRMRESIVISKRKGTICNQQTSLRVPEIWMSLFQ